MSCGDVWLFGVMVIRFLLIGMGIYWIYRKMEQQRCETRSRLETVLEAIGKPKEQSEALIRADGTRNQIHDLEKLSTFSQRFPLPSMYRIHVWKVLLGVVPPHSDSHSLVGGYRKEQYQDIVEALEVMRYINSSTPATHIYLRMFQLESQVLPRCSETLPPDDENEDFLAISRAMEEIVDDPIDCYWLIKCFINQFHLKFGDSLPHLPKSLEHYLSQEEPRLLNHLRSIGALPQLPYGLWFKRCFAGCLPESSLQRVWDKVISGSCKILVFVALEILLSYKIMLLSNTRPDGVVTSLCNIPQENTDAIVTKALDLWQKYCGNPNHAP